MKKKKYFIAATSLVVLQPAIAQLNSSNVTLYGTLDIGLARLFNDQGTSVRGSKFPSNWGIRGREDLGNGLYASFNLESSPISVDTGSYNDAGAFTRQSWVGLGGSFGEVIIGRTTTPQARFMGRYDLNGLSEVNPWKTLGVSANGSFGGARHSNQVQYASPQIGNFQFRGSYSFDETQKGLSGSRDGQLQMGLNYKNSNWTTGVVIMPKKLSGKLDAVSKSLYQDAFSLGLMYENSSLKISALFQRDEQKALGQSLGLGASVAFGALEVGSQFAKILSSSNEDYKNATSFELFANYKISKQTTLYAIAAGVDDKAKNVNNLKNKYSTAVGVLKRF